MGGRVGLKEGGGGGGGFGWDPAPPRVPLWSPSEAGQKFLSLNPLGTEAKFRLPASNIGRGGGGGVHGGYHPSSYGVRPL